MSLPRLKRTGRPGGRREGRRPAHNASEELFSHFTLNKDPAASKYMPYDEVAYPSLLRETRHGGGGQAYAAEELETMWMAGQLDYERRTEMKRVAASFRPFLELPGSTMLPGAATEAQRLDRKKRREARRHEPKDGLEKGEHGGHAAPHHAALSETEEMRLKHLAETLLFPRKEVNVYAQTNRQLRRAVLEKKPRRIEPTLRSDVVSTMAQRYRREAAASTVLCRAWRSRVRARLLAERIIRERVVVLIQALARSHVARRFVAIWHASGQTLAVKWQARLRRAFACKRARLRVRVDVGAQGVIHRYCRGFIGRRRAARGRRNLGASRIQMLWRGCRARCAADKVWLHRLVVPIQRRARGLLGRIRAAALGLELRGQALVVQRCFRGYRARVACRDALYDRESRQLAGLLRFLASEGVRLTDRAAALEKRIKRRRLRERADAARAAARDGAALVLQTETRYLNLVDEHTLCTPRSIAAGWRDELATNVADHRRMITRQKADLLFSRLRAQREADTALAFQQHEVEIALAFAAHQEEYREAEIARERARESRRFHDRAARGARQKVGDQRRAWAVRLFNPAGKPRRRARGPTGAPPAGHEVFCGGTVDLFAANDDETFRLGSEEALKAIDEKLRLQTWLNQVAQVDALFEPLHPQLRRMQGAADEAAGADGETAARGYEAAWRAGAADPNAADDEDLTAGLAFYDAGGARAPGRRRATHHRADADDGALVPYDEHQSLEPNEFYDEARSRGASDEPPGRAPARRPLAPRAAPRAAAHLRERQRPAKPGRIPWALLDELEAEKTRFRSQVAVDLAFGKG
ncbi:hypothetical protein M885DRAFT_273748 [Pelagophyceae sp. CCMP2097]|nr:hypothetical protein M885DRAFT_273748 [Pelagophyceae sp. CCMP2097]